ncbi:hypothetical protein D3C86_1486920 [compost metagenome]
MDQAQGHQAVDRLDAVDRMAARDGDARLGADRGPAFQHPANGLNCQLADRHPDDGQGEDRRRPHGVDVGQGVGGGDPAKVERVVDHGHEEVRRGDQGLFVVQPPHSRVVRRLGPHHQIGEGRRLGRAGQDGLEHVGRDLAAATAAMGQGRQSGFCLGHAPASRVAARRSSVLALIGDPGRGDPALRQLALQAVRARQMARADRDEGRPGAREQGLNLIGPGLVPVGQHDGVHFRGFRLHLLTDQDIQTVNVAGRPGRDHAAKHGVSLIKLLEA